MLKIEEKLGFSERDLCFLLKCSSSLSLSRRRKGDLERGVFMLLCSGLVAYSLGSTRNCKPGSWIDSKGNLMVGHHPNHLIISRYDYLRPMVMEVGIIILIC